MTRLFAGPGPARPPLPAYARQRLDGWIAMLDVDLDAAQAMLRVDPLRMPLPPIDLPAVLADDGTVLAEAVAADPTGGPVEPEPETRPAAALRGAYARRAARNSGTG
jgi:hypothetical protein